LGEKPGKLASKNKHIIEWSYFLRINAFLLLLSSAFILLIPMIPYLEYIIRKDFIIENFCVNIEKPETQCNGKCHLEKKIEKEAKRVNDREVPFLPQNEKKELPEYLITEQMSTAPCKARAKTGSEYQGRYFYQYVPSIFHPPMKG
jgi:hypothetical protein